MLQEHFSLDASSGEYACLFINFFHTLRIQWVKRLPKAGKLESLRDSETFAFTLSSTSSLHLENGRLFFLRLTVDSSVLKVTVMKFTCPWLGQLKPAIATFIMVSSDRLRRGWSPSKCQLCQGEARISKWFSLVLLYLKKKKKIWRSSRNLDQS